MFKLNQEKFLQEINAKWTNKNCPMCSHNSWQVASHMVTALKLDEKGGIQLGGEVMPFVAITCSNCGNVMLVNPLVLKSVDIIEEGENK